MATTTKRNVKISAGAALAVGAATLVAPGHASAADPATSATMTPLDQSASLLRSASASHPADVGVNTGVVLPTVASSKTTVALKNDAGTAVIGLPFTVTAATKVQSLDANTTVYRDAATQTDVSVQPLVSGGVRMMVVANSASSPTEYRFTMGDPGAVTLKLEVSGGVSVADASGGDVGYVAPPWAQDANGKAVPTSFTVDGNTLVQHVNHKGAAYPVVADPSFQGDCGYVTCTLRLNRAMTKNARDAGAIIGIAAGACATFSGPVAIVCGAAIAPAAGITAVLAARYYDDGDCIKFKFYPVPPTGAAIPERLDHGTYNCTGK